MNIDFAGAMKSIVPGTFVPDLSGNETPNVGPIPGDATGVAAVTGVAGSDTVSSFKDTVKSMLSDVNDKVNTSDQNMKDMATGKTNDLGKVVTSVEEANLALQYTMAIRTKLLDAYSEISRLQV